MTDSVAASPLSERDYVESIKAAVARHKWNPIVVWQGVHRTLTVTMEMVMSFHPDWMNLHVGVEHDEVELGHNVAFMKQLSRSLNIDTPDMVFPVPAEETGLRVVSWLHAHGALHFRKLKSTDKQIYFYTTLDSWVHLLERTLELCDAELAMVVADETTAKGRKKLAYATIRGMCQFNIEALRQSAPRRNKVLKNAGAAARREMQADEALGAAALEAARIAAAEAKAKAKTDKARKPKHAVIDEEEEKEEEDGEEEEEKGTVTAALADEEKAESPTHRSSPVVVVSAAAAAATAAVPTEARSTQETKREDRDAWDMERRIAHLRVDDATPSQPSILSPEPLATLPPTPPTPGPPSDAATEPNTPDAAPESTSATAPRDPCQ